VRRPRSLCSVDPCGKWVKANGFCAMHLSRFERHGSPTARLKGDVVDGKRICPRCQVDKPLDQWGTNARTKSGISGYCKPCMGDVQSAFRAKPSYIRSPRDAKQEREYARAWRLRNPDAVRSQCAAYRARRQQATIERFSVTEIFERDGWLCHLCREPIDPALPYPAPMSASLDHVVPLAKGGEHSRANVAASHLICNMRKKDRMVVAACAP
jgi:5-methylcytosine-specific restriction endonuclease McrA